MAYFTYEDDLHPEVEPLTKEEITWIKRLEKVLKSCPSDRLELVTIGDPNLNVIDSYVGDLYGYDLEDGKAEKVGIVVAGVTAKMKIHGVTG